MSPSRRPPPPEDNGDTIEVEGLGAPEPELNGTGELPPEPEPLGELEPAQAPDPQLLIESLTVGLEAPFAIVAMRHGAHWRVTPDEVRPIAEALALVIPANAIAQRMVAASPWASAGVQLYALVQLRLEQDAALAEGATDDTLPRPRLVPDQAPPGAAAGRPGADLRGEPEPDGEDPGTRAHSGAGLGLGSPGIGERPAGHGE